MTLSKPAVTATRSPQYRHVFAATTLMMTLVLCALPLSAAIYYVDAANGSDANSGAPDAPLRTIQAAADRMNAGDECIIRGGVYRETVTVKSDNITFRAQQLAHVVVSGAERVTGWTQHDGNIYKAPMSWDQGHGRNQIFVNGRMVFEARWPNVPDLDISNPKRAVAGPDTYGYGHTARIIDSNLPDYDWTGGIVNILSGKQWNAWSGVVTGSSSGRLDVAIDHEVRAPYYRWDPGNPYYVTGVYDALDMPGEWFLDTESGTLYLRSLDDADPNTQTVEARRRDIGFDLSGRTGVTIKGIHLFACTIKTNGASSGCVLDGIQANYVTHYTRLLQGPGSGRGHSGILLKGTGHVLRNSLVAYSAGDGVYITGAGHAVENCTIHDANYGASYAALIRTEHADDILIFNNKLFNSARDGINHMYHSTNLRILRNEIYDFGLQCDDLGGTYTYSTDGRGTVIAYNRIHSGDTSGLMSSGIYIDDDSSNFIIHHNVVWKVGRGIHLNSNSRNHQVFNNTIHASVGEAGFGSYGDKTGTIIRNNIWARGSVWFQGFGHTLSHNYLARTSGPVGFVDEANDDFRLTPSSPCVDTGVDVGLDVDILGTPIPQGAAPDRGAYEYTGSTLNPPPSAPLGVRIVE